MAKDLNDNVTMALIPEPKKRGRPASGKALSNAERQRRFRKNQGKKVRFSFSESEWKELLAALRHRYVEDEFYYGQLQFAQIVESVWRAGCGNEPLPLWFKEYSYKG